MAFSFLVKTTAHVQWNVMQTEHVHFVQWTMDIYDKVAQLKGTQEWELFGSDCGICTFS